MRAEGRVFPLHPSDPWVLRRTLQEWNSPELQFRFETNSRSLFCIGFSSFYTSPVPASHTCPLGSLPEITCFYTNPQLSSALLAERHWPGHGASQHSVSTESLYSTLWCFEGGVREPYVPAPRWQRLRLSPHALLCPVSDQGGAQSARPPARTSSPTQ